MSQMLPAKGFRSVSRSLLRRLARFAARGKRVAICLGLLVTIFTLWLQIDAPELARDLIQRLEYLVYDQRLSIMPKPVKSAANKISIIDLDERSLQAEGQYPWNRIKVGQLVEKLRDNGVLVVGFDITFPEPDRNIRDLLAEVDLQALGDEFNQTLASIEPQIDSDQYFANAMQSGIDVVLAINFNSQSTATYNDLPPSIVDIGEELATASSVTNMTGYTGNITLLQEAALGSGSMNQLPDADGIVRKVPLVIRYGTQLFPTLSLEMIRVYNFEESYQLITEGYGDLEVVKAIRIGKGAGTFEIPTDGLGWVNVPYVGRSSLGNNEHYSYISATDVLNDNLSEDEKTALHNGLVLVGTSAPGLGDIRAMPLEQVYHGVEVHANMLNALLDSVATVEVASGTASTASVFASFQASNDIYFPYKPDWEAGALFFVTIILGLLMALAFPYLGAASLAATASALIVLIIWVNFQLWSLYKLDFSLVLLLLLVLMVSTVNMVYGFLAESRTRKTIKGMFDQYAPPAHIDSMLQDPDNYSFAGENKELTVLFADIRNFTTISEALSATQLKTLLNDFFTPITGIIFKHNGTIDKYVGDMVMAFWGAPLDDVDHRANALRSALEMLEKVEELKQGFLEQGLPEVNVGIGLNTGFMNVGDMGSTYRRSYTVLGDAVNLGSRLESLTKFYGIRLLVGQETVKDLDGFLFRLIDRVKVKVKGKGKGKGKEEAIDCYQPLCEKVAADNELRSRVESYHQALACYHSQDWDGAQEKFTTLLQQEPETLLYQIYLDRVATLRDASLPSH